VDRVLRLSVAARADELLRQQQQRIHRQTDRLFAVLFVIQWLAAVAAAQWLSPRTWAGTQSAPHIHVWAAVYVGGLITAFPIILVLTRAAQPSTRYVIAVAQMLMSSLLIQLTGGRIETHFHVFGSLAFLSFYRDWRVLVPATIVVAADHFLRGSFWPQSVFGTLVVDQWRWMEHAGWVAFENIFLTVACLRSNREMRDVSERSAELEASEERYRSIMEQAAEGICLLDPLTREVVESNRTFGRLLDRTRTAPRETPADGFTAVRRVIDSLVASSGATGSPVPHDCELRRADGSPLYLSVTVSRISFGSREVLCASVRDVTERRLVQEALRQSEERYVRAARGANDGLWDWDLTTGEVYFSPRWKEMLGVSDQHLRNFDQWLKRVHDDDHSPFLAAVHDHITGQSEYFEHQHRMLHADGSYRWMLCRGLLARDEKGKPARMAGSQTDVTERHLANEKLRHAALHDTLTGLPNRSLFGALLERAVGRTMRHPDDMFGVLFVDIDGFKVINDSLGHLVGDQLLQQIGRRIRDCLRSADVVARFGGDEFTILADDIAHPDDAVAVAAHIQDVLKEGFVVSGHEIRVSASIGIAVGSIHYARGEELLRDADVAMYRAKALGKNRCELFADSAPSRSAADICGQSLETATEVPGVH
jgi:diguanylate cyclase (GGDEF)-like protein/PAS domain S-box-containing protein